MKIGVVGIGAIASDVVRAVLTGPHANDYEFVVSPRNAERAASLKSAFAQVTIAESNQAVLDASDIVMLGILPKQFEEVVGELTFRADHIVASLVAGHPPSKVAQLVAPASTTCQLIPLPFVALHKGPVIMSPAIPEIVKLFDGLGETVVIEDEAQIIIGSIMSATMSSFLQWQKVVVDWGVAQGFNAEAAKQYVTSLYEGLSVETAHMSVDGLTHMVPEHETPGGLNEYLRKSLESDGTFVSLTHHLDELMNRWKPKS